MADIFSKATRSRIMSSIRGKDTKLEMTVRRALHSLGLRYNLHDRRLPGRPDLVFPRYKVALLVNGCWWHQHDCGRFKPPKSNLEYWGPKLKKGSTYDAEIVSKLKDLGWNAIIVWECEIKKGVDWNRLAERIRGGAK
jgi:DNA mismatch endonuclease (patch repair protein)